MGGTAEDGLLGHAVWSGVVAVVVVVVVAVRSSSMGTLRCNPCGGEGWWLGEAPGAQPGEHGCCGGTQIVVMCVVVMFFGLLGFLLL